MSWTTDEMAARAAADIPPGTVVNLGVGLPTKVAAHLGPDVWVHSENGILGMGPAPDPPDLDVVNASKQPVTVLPGGACFDSSLSFAMIRGGHVDLAILGAMQVGASGDLANWAIPGGRTMGMGGAMDLASGAKQVWVVTRALTRDGQPKLLPRCTYPLTAAGVVGRVYCELGVIGVTDGGFALIEAAPGVSRRTVAQAVPLSR